MLRPLHISKRSAILILGMALAVVAHAQPSKSEPQAPPAKAPAKTAAAPSGQAPAKAPAKASAPAPAKAPAKAQAKASPQKPAPPKPAAKKPSKPAAKPEEAAKKEEEAPVAKPHGRDPFLALIAAGAGPPVRLPPGKAGLQVSTVRVDGIFRSQNGMIVVVSNPQGRTYFLHQGDRLFDGRVEQVSMDAVTFDESGKDPFGKEIQRTVVKRVYPSAGEQQ